VRFSMLIPNLHDWEDVAALALLADQGDWDTIWYADHYMPDTGSAEVVDGDVYEAWSILSAVAAITSRVRIGPLVSPTSVHHPALLANRAATIDQISAGRFVLGMGAGWQITEHSAYGIDLEPAGKRVSRFEESIEIVRSLLDNERTTFDGAFYRFSDAPCQPHPAQDKLPILVGTGSPRMMRAAARFAQEWNTWGSPTHSSEAMYRFETACAEVGTDPASIRKSVQALVFMSDDEETLAKHRDTVDMTRSIVGTPTQLAETIGRYAERGFDEFIVLGHTLGQDAAQRQHNFRRFAAEITSQF
jgi:alkanesulfonate monooxygenase SsuD/methylene tetrahydromethanopterin reductase-like flavin-dependent oxidoreductase (luciferase family)